MWNTPTFIGCLTLKIKNRSEANGIQNICGFAFCRKWFIFTNFKMKWIATLCSRYASPPPLYEKFSSSFRFVKFSHWTVQIWKMSKKELRNEGLVVHLRILHTFSSFGQKIYGQKVFNIWPFRFYGTFLSAFFDNSVRAFSKFLVKTEWSKMSL